MEHRHAPRGVAAAAAAAAEAVARLDLGSWVDVAPHLRPRVVPAERSTALARPLTAGLAIDLAVVVGPGLVRPPPDAVRSWDRSAAESWAVAVDNLAGDGAVWAWTAPRDRWGLTVVGGTPYAGGVAADPQRLLRPRLAAAGNDVAEVPYDGRRLAGWLALPAADTALFAPDQPLRLARLAGRWAQEVTGGPLLALLHVAGGAVRPVAS